MDLFDFDNIIELATDNSYKKGEDYFANGCVSKVIKNRNVFKGIVSGNKKYEVSLEVSNGDLDFSCNCPYEFGGICKHSVALALAILDDNFIDIDKKYVKNEEVQQIYFKELFKNSDTHKKITFLEQLLNRDNDIQSQFINFVENKTTTTAIITGVNINSIREEIYEELSSLDFDDAIENYDSYNGYYYNDEGSIDEAYNLIENVIEGYEIQSIQFIKKGNIADAFRVIAGIYEGSQCLEEPDDNYGMFDGDYNERTKEFVIESFKNIANEIKQVILSDENVFQAIEIIIERFNYYENIVYEEKDVEDDENKRIIYDFKDFESLLLSIIQNKKTAEYLYDIIQKTDLECLGMAYILLKIAEITENEKLWLETAENFASFEKEITKQLLEKYKGLNSKENFVRIAKTAFEQWTNDFDLYLMKNLDKNAEKDLYIKALYNYSLNKKSIEHFKELKEYLTEVEKDEFINKAKKGYDNVFYVKLLEIEKQYDKILSFVRKNYDSYFSDFNEIILPILNIYPDECFTIIKNKCEIALKSTKRDRHTYQNMVSWLKIMKLIVLKQNEIHEYLQKLFNHKPNLPSLKDEMKKGGLI